MRMYMYRLSISFTPRPKLCIDNATTHLASREGADGREWDGEEEERRIVVDAENEFGLWWRRMINAAT